MEKVYEQAPENLVNYLELAHAYVIGGRIRKALALTDAVAANVPRSFLLRLGRGLIHAAEGKKESARKELDSQTLRFAEINARHTDGVVEIYALLGEKHQALDWLDRAARAGDERAEWWEKNPLLANLRNEPRFRQMIESMRFRRSQREATSP